MSKKKTTHPEAASQLPLVAYGRVSRDAGRSKAGTLHSDDLQLKEAHQIAERFGEQVWPEAFVDINRSGSSFDREGFQTILELVKAGQAGGIVVTLTDRLSRADIRTAIMELGEIEELGGRILTSNGYRSFRGDAVLTFIVELMQANAEYEKYLKRGTDTRRAAILERRST